jgi:hypothetical protein
LACVVGVNGALIIQQINYWIQKPKVGQVVNGQRWVKNNLEEWRENNFPFLSPSTIQRTLDNLKKTG